MEMVTAFRYKSGFPFCSCWFQYPPSKYAKKGIRGRRRRRELEPNNALSSDMGFVFTVASDAFRYPPPPRLLSFCSLTFASKSNWRSQKSISYQFSSYDLNSLIAIFFRDWFFLSLKRSGWTNSFIPLLTEFFILRRWCRRRTKALF
jgi:hypothetical protein